MGGTSHLYRMILRKDNTARVEIDEEKIYDGNIKEDWEVLKPKEISDPADKKPDDWDDEEDGEWEAPMKDNPEYKGDWSGKRISNPEYEDDDSVYKFADFGFIGFDLWQVKGGTIFDNVIITDDAAEADTFAKKWKALSEVEKTKKKEEEDSKKTDDKKKEDEDDDDDDDAKKDDAEEM